jgi:predicted outer membrane protein
VYKFLLSVTVTAAVYCASSFPAVARARQNDLFMEKAIEANAAEIELSKMAESKAEDPQVKAYAEMLVKDHTKALNRLQRNQDTAEPHDTELSLEHMEMRDRLSELSGTDFDNAYLAAMIEEHRKGIKEFEREAEGKSAESADSTSDTFTVSREKPEPVTGGQNSAIARELLPMLRMDLQQGMDLQEKTK